MNLQEKLQIFNACAGQKPSLEEIEGWLDQVALGEERSYPKGEIFKALLEKAGFEMVIEDRRDGLDENVSGKSIFYTHARADGPLVIWDQYGGDLNEANLYVHVLPDRPINSFKENDYPEEIRDFVRFNFMSFNPRYDAPTEQSGVEEYKWTWRIGDGFEILYILENLKKVGQFQSPFKEDNRPHLKPSFFTAADFGYHQTLSGLDRFGAETSPEVIRQIQERTSRAVGHMVQLNEKIRILRLPAWVRQMVFNEARI